MLAYLLDRGPLQESGGSAALPTGPRCLPSRQWSATLILRRLADGVTVDSLASELDIAPETMRAALRDLARRSHVSGHLAEILERIADGKTIAQVASELELTGPAVAAELAPTETLEQGLGALLMARAALPVVPAGYLGAPPQGPLRTMPVRFPEAQYHRLKDWSEAHGFPMAVVVRGVVERFLDEQERRGT